MAVLAYSFGKVKIGPFVWESNGTWTEEVADVLVILFAIYYSGHGAVVYKYAVNKRINSVNHGNWIEDVKPW